MFKRTVKNLVRAGQAGTTLVEVLVALALLGIIGSSFFSATASTTSARVQADERASSKIIAESVLDSVKKAEFASSYNVSLSGEYTGYSVNITVDDIGYAIQKVIVQVGRQQDEVFTLEGYKVRR